MDIFAQKKLLVRIVIILILLNLFSIVVFWWKGFPHHDKPELFPSQQYRDVSSILEKELNLNEKQVEQIKNLRSVYFEKEKDLATIIRAERDSMNSLMFNKQTDETLVKNLAKKVSENGYKMELLRYEQAQELKTICTLEQLNKFEKLVLEIRDYFRPDNQPKRK